MSITINGSMAEDAAMWSSVSGTSKVREKEAQIVNESEEDDLDIAAADVRLAASDPATRRSLKDLRQQLGR